MRIFLYSGKSLPNYSAIFKMFVHQKELLSDDITVCSQRTEQSI
jgi:hypothetical protein